MPSKTKNQIDENAFAFLRTNERTPKPRKCGVTEIRGSYYTPLGKRQLEDILEMMGKHVDALKFAGGSFSLIPRHALTEIISLCHDHDVLCSTGGFIEHVLTQGPEAVNRYIKECKEVGFDILEVSSGFITLPADDWLCLVERVAESETQGKTGSGHPIRGRWHDHGCGTKSLGQKDQPLGIARPLAFELREPTCS